jgi:hypothetical protein
MDRMGRWWFSLGDCVWTIIGPYDVPPKSGTQSMSSKTSTRRSWRSGRKKNPQAARRGAVRHTATGSEAANLNAVQHIAKRVSNVLRRLLVGIHEGCTPRAGVVVGSAPKELYGKSVTVTWTETRSQRFQSEQQVRNIGVAMELNIYQYSRSLFSTAQYCVLRVRPNALAHWLNGHKALSSQP